MTSANNHTPCISMGLTVQVPHISMPLNDGDRCEHMGQGKNSATVLRQYIEGLAGKITSSLQST